MDAERQPETPYVLGHSDQELERLISQARLYKPFTMQFFRDAGIAEGMRMLDAGCGTGDVSFLAARMVGRSGHLIGIDRAEIAVESASRRAADLHLANVKFMVEDAADIGFEEPFDAVVGRFVLQWCPDPIAVLRQLTTLVRPGGVIAFQEPDWCWYHARPPMPTWDRCARWIPETIGRSSGDPYLGMTLFATFTSAGLPAPSLYVNAPIAAGLDHPLYAHAAELVRTLLPTMEQLGVASVDEVGIATLAARLRDEAAASGGTVVWLSLIGAATRKPAE